METSHNTAKTVCFFSRLAVLAGMADILDRLESCSLANLEVFDSFSDFDDHARAFVASTLGAELRPDEGQHITLLMEDD